MKTHCQLTNNIFGIVQIFNKNVALQPQKNTSLNRPRLKLVTV